MTGSMTGHAARAGRYAGWSWSWDLRAGNARAPDLRLRVPDGIEGLEQAVRSAVQRAVDRGSISLTLRLTREAVAGFAIDKIALEQAIAPVREVEAAAAAGGLTLAPPRASDLIAMRGVMAAGATSEEAEAPRAALMADLPARLLQLDVMRRREGAALAERVGDQLDAIAALLTRARGEAAERLETAPARVQTAVARLMQAADGLDEARIMQEVALIASKGDVTEELDRLEAHVAAARELLARSAPTGRKLDFLVQEFNRDANTLCAKSQSVPLTRTGLDLKATIEQMREQVQNLE